MRTFPVVVLVLLAFAAFFLTFLLAPLAVLTLFYVAYAMRSGKEEEAPPPSAPVEDQQPWDARPAEGADVEPPAAAPARRARITVVSRADRLALEQAAASEAADADADEPDPDRDATPTPAAPRAT